MELPWQGSRMCSATMSYAGWSRFRSATCGSRSEGSSRCIGSALGKSSNFSSQNQFCCASYTFPAKGSLMMLIPSSSGDPAKVFATFRPHKLQSMLASQHKWHSNKNNSLACIFVKFLCGPNFCDGHQVCVKGSCFLHPTNMFKGTMSDRGSSNFHQNPKVQKAASKHVYMSLTGAARQDNFSLGVLSGPRFSGFGWAGPHLSPRLYNETWIVVCSQVTHRLLHVSDWGGTPRQLFFGSAKRSYPAVKPHFRITTAESCAASHVLSPCLPKTWPP